MSEATAPHSGLVGVLLAAGFGRRYAAAAGDVDKLLQPMADGLPLVVRAATALRAALPDSVAVVRPDSSSELVARLSEGGLQVVVAPAAAGGMAYSLAAAAMARPSASAWLVALADMPWIRGETIARVAAAVTATTLAAPCHAGRRGHPVAFGAAYRDELLLLTGDHGAREVLQRHAKHLRLVEVNDPGILADVDTPADRLSNRP